MPELRLADEEAAAAVTVLHLLDHTSGPDWNLIDTDEEDRSLAGFVAEVSRLTLLAAPARPSYSQAAYDLAGRVVEKVRGMPFEKAVASLLLEPIGLSDTCFDLDDVVTRTYALGYNRGQDGALRVATPWKAFRGGTRAPAPM